VLDNLTEKMDKCPAVELGVPQYPLKKKKMIAHGPSNKQYASKSWQVLNFQSLWSKSMAFLSSDPVLIMREMQSKYAWEFLQIKTAPVRYKKDNEWPERTYEDKGMLNFFSKIYKNSKW